MNIKASMAIILLFLICLPLSAQEEEVELFTDDNVMLSGRFLRANSPLAPAVILIHSLGEKKESWDGFSDFVNKAGFFVLALDLRSHGESGGGKHWLYFSDSQFTAMTLDVKAGVDFLRAQPGVNRDAVILVGSGVGGSLVLLYAVRDLRIAGVVILSPGIDYCGLSLLNPVNRYRGRPLLLLSGEEDVYSSYSVEQLKETVGESCDVVILPAAGHGTRMLFTKEGLSSNIIDWLLKVAP
jgi:alpha-beta hydrolase superfamily lysophospholipase